MVQVIFTAFLRISRKKIRKRSFRLFLISILYYYFYGQFLPIPMGIFYLSLWVKFTHRKHIPYIYSIAYFSLIIFFIFSLISKA